MEYIYHISPVEGHLKIVPTQSYTPLKTNIAHENQWLKDDPFFLTNI